MLRRLVCLFLLVLASPAAAQSLHGRAEVSDGDSLRIGAARIRLFGIDAPELDQRCDDAAGQGWDCGLWARDRLAALADGRWLTCRAEDRDAYGRIVATCRAAGADIGAAMVAEGAATAYRRYSDRYVAAETAARRARRGLWRGAFELPETHRRGGDPAPEAAEAAAGEAGAAGCAIKGNISAAGRRLYHLPGGRDYAATRIDASKGERWFCTEAEARAAGWQRAR